MTDHYAVVGNPVAHSVSPVIHAAFAQETGQDIDYIRLLAPFDAFAATVTAFLRDGGAGVNVTVPFKHEAWKLVESHGGAALDARAVNTIHLRDGRMIGYNTDGTGLMADLERNLAFRVQGRRVLLMGAGGATHGVMHPVLSANPACVVVANRTLDKAVQLVDHYRKLGPFTCQSIAARPYQEIAGSQFDLVINSTSAGLSGEMPPLPAGIFAAGALAYDMVYGKATPFMRFAAAQGAAVADGTGMLVEQAAESFYIWRGVRPATAPVIAAVRAMPR